MKKQVFVLLVLILLVLVIAETSRTEPIVIQNVTVLTMENDQLHQNHTVIIQNGVIQWVGHDSEATIPEGAVIIEGNYYVMPGLAEMHAHIPPPREGMERMEATLALYLSQGVTTIRGMLGNPAHLELRDRAAAGELVSPRIFTSGPSFNSNSATDPVTTRNMVREQFEAGYDLLKFHPGISLENFEAATEEANRLNFEFSGHISFEVGLERSLKAGKGTIDHLDRYMEFLAGEVEGREDPPIIYFGYDLTPMVNQERIEDAAKLTANAGVWNVPTNTLLENVFNPYLELEEMKNWPGMNFIPENVVNGWVNYVRSVRESDAYDPDQAIRFLEIRKELTRALYMNGAGLLLGADAPQIFNPPGFSVHRELHLLTEAGLTAYEAIKTGTVNIGTYLGEPNLTGKVAPGYRADLILLSTNPLESIPFMSFIEGVIYQGNYISREELDDLLSEIQDILNE